MGAPSRDAILERPSHDMMMRRMDVERIIDDIEQLQEMFEAADIRPFGARGALHRQ
jgi:hypothetical protein